MKEAQRQTGDSARARVTSIRHLPCSLKLAMGSPSTASSSPPSPSAPSAIHPPSFQSIPLELLNPIMAPVFLVLKVVLRKVGITLPGQAIWQSWSERKQAFWAPFIYAAFLSVAVPPSLDLGPIVRSGLVGSRQGGEA